MTTAHLIDGKAFAAKLRGEIKEEVARLSFKPGLAVVLVGDNPASDVYVRNKIKACAEVGIESLEHRLPDSTTQDELLALVEKLNQDKNVHGILVQFPVPDQIDQNVVINAISPAKDVDGLHPVNAGKLMAGEPGLVPCTPLGCIKLLKSECADLAGKNAVVIGRSNLVGKPVAHLLLQENCTVTIAHSKTQDIETVCASADILVAAVGKPEMVRGDWIKPGALVIDVGINRVEGKLVGDVCFDEAVKIAGAITPVPGGVGPMTIACLLENTVRAATKL